MENVLVSQHPSSASPLRPDDCLESARIDPLEHDLCQSSPGQSVFSDRRSIHPVETLRLAPVSLELLRLLRPIRDVSAVGRRSLDSLLRSRRSTHTVYVKSVLSVVESLCSIVQAHPMLLIYLNDYMEENHASPAAYIFFLKLFTFLRYPLLTFHYFHPFHPQVTPRSVVGR